MFKVFSRKMVTVKPLRRAKIGDIRTIKCLPFTFVFQDHKAHFMPQFVKRSCRICDYANCASNEDLMAHIMTSHPKSNFFNMPEVKEEVLPVLPLNLVYYHRFSTLEVICIFLLNCSKGVAQWIKHLPVT